MEHLELFKDLEKVDNIGACFFYLNSPSSVYFVAPQIKDLFKCALDDIKKCIKTLDKSENLENFEYRNIEKGLNILLDLQIENILDENFHSFINSYVYLAYNVNKNTLNSSIIDNKCLQILRYTGNKLTLNETLILFKSVSNRLIKWKEFLPPSFRLSEHYYKIIREE
jgi:hypothetical protein